MPMLGSTMLHMHMHTHTIYNLASRLRVVIIMYSTGHAWHLQQEASYVSAHMKGYTIDILTGSVHFKERGGEFTRAISSWIARVHIFKVLFSFTQRSVVLIFLFEAWGTWPQPRQHFVSHIRGLLFAAPTAPRTCQRVREFSISSQSMYPCLRFFTATSTAYPDPVSSFWTPG